MNKINAFVYNTVLRFNPHSAITQTVVGVLVFGLVLGVLALLVAASHIPYMWVCGYAGLAVVLANLCGRFLLENFPQDSDDEDHPHFS